MKTTILDFSYLLPDLDSFIDDSYEKWLSDTRVSHDNNHDGLVNEDDYLKYLEEVSHEC